MIYVISDLHLGHTNILKHTDRGERYGLSTIEEHDEAIKQAWHDTIKQGDIVYVLGDVSWDHRSEMSPLHGWTGRKFLIRGNHDKKARHARTRNVPTNGWEGVDDLLEFKHEKHRWVFCHYPMLTWNGASKGSYHLHGHCHGQLDPTLPKTTRLDVSIDATGTLKPVSLYALQDLLDLRSYHPVDHHKPE